LIVFQLHLDYILMLHFNCIFIALDYDCMIITLRLHFYYITFGRLRYDCNGLLAIPCSFIAKTLHFYCMQFCILIASELRICLATISPQSRFYLATISFVSHQYLGFILVSLQFGNCTALGVQSYDI
jgi:hypothetical protein